jgi:hypothetical protein
MVGYTYHEAVYYLLDCAPTLDSFAAEVEAGLAFVRRTGSEQTGQMLDGYRWPAVQRGESADAGGEAVPSTSTPTTRWRFSSLRSSRAIAAAPREDPGHHASLPPRGPPRHPGRTRRARLWCPHGKQRSDGVARRAPDGG